MPILKIYIKDPYLITAWKIYKAKGQYKNGEEALRNLTEIRTILGQNAVIRITKDHRGKEPKYIPKPKAPI